MLLLALAAWEGHPADAARRRTMGELAAGILRQQRLDGSLHIYFEPGGPGLEGSDPGWQLYGGEAAYAVGTAYGRLQDGRLLRATAAALRAFQAKYRHACGGVGPAGCLARIIWRGRATPCRLVAPLWGCCLLTAVLPPEAAQQTSVPRPAVPCPALPPLAQAGRG